MGTIRTLLVVGATAFAGLCLITATAQARTECSGSTCADAQATTARAKEPDDGVMRGRDSISLIALLPWWRSDPMQAIRSRAEEIESPVLAAADAWLAALVVPAEGAAARSLEVAAADNVEAGHPANGPLSIPLNVADPNEINEIDLAAADQPQPADPSWFYGWLAILGGALAAVSAAGFLLFDHQARRARSGARTAAVR